MSIEALILGKLHQPAEQRTGKSGRPFVIAKLRAPAGDDMAVFVSVVTFSESVGAALMALGAGDAVALGGTLKPGAWIDREGKARPSADLIATQALTVYGLAKKRAAVRVDTQAQPQPHGQQDAGDELGAGPDPWLDEGAA